MPNKRNFDNSPSKENVCVTVFNSAGKHIVRAVLIAFVVLFMLWKLSPAAFRYLLVIGVFVGLYVCSVAVRNQNNKKQRRK